MDINLTELGKFSIGALCFVICVYLICKSKWTGPIEAVKLAVSYLTSIGTRIKNILKHIAYRQLYDMAWFFKETGYGALHDFLTELRDKARTKHVSANEIIDGIREYETRVDLTGFDFLHRCIRIAKKHSTTIHTLLEQLSKHIETCAKTKYNIEELSDNDRNTLISDCTKLIDVLQGFVESINEHHIQVLMLY
jgi:hypothetical protein